MSKPRSNFNYTFDKVEGVPFLCIVDENRGAMSVTNDIENVVESIIAEEKQLPKECLIIYCDSDGIWDGWNNDTQSFVALQAQSKAEAQAKYILKTKQF